MSENGKKNQDSGCTCYLAIFCVIAITIIFITDDSLCEKPKKDNTEKNPVKMSTKVEIITASHEIVRKDLNVFPVKFPNEAGRIQIFEYPHKTEVLLKSYAEHPNPLGIMVKTRYMIKWERKKGEKFKFVSIDYY